MKLFIFAALCVGLVFSACPNQCSGSYIFPSSALAPHTSHPTLPPPTMCFLYAYQATGAAVLMTSVSVFVSKVYTRPIVMVSREQTVVSVRKGRVRSPQEMCFPFRPPKHHPLPFVPPNNCCVQVPVPWGVHMTAFLLLSPL